MPTQAYNVSSALEERIKGQRTALDFLRAMPSDYQLFAKPALPGAEQAEPALDYIIAHKTLGLLGVVVKSGEIVEEPGGFISQFQPQKQLYKILDPVKPAEATAENIIKAFDAIDGDKIFPVGIVVLFPDTQRHEFTSGKNNYLFAEDLSSVDFLGRMNGYFRRPEDGGLMAKFRAHFSRLEAFLKSHSDNAALFEGERVKQLAEAKKATPPVAPVTRITVAPPQAIQAMQARALQPPVAMPEPEEEASVRPAEAEPEVQKVRAFALPPLQPIDDLALAKAAKARAPVALPAGEMRRRASLRAALPAASRQKDMFHWMEEIEQKGEGDAGLSTGQWLMIASVAVVIICAVYFMARNFALATAAG